MRGADAYNEALFSTVKLEEFVPQTQLFRPAETAVRPERSLHAARGVDRNGSLTTV